MPILDLTKKTSKTFSVSELNLRARLLLEGHFGMIKVEGEISNLATPRSGHSYFSLKDQSAQIRCAFFKGYRTNSPIQPEDGLKVTVHARVSLFEGRGDYQLIVEKIEQSLEGDLKRQFELLKQALSNEGLFEDTHKKALPTIPKTIGVISSSTGAALQDILSTLKRRAPYCQVIVYPCQVQGEHAKEQISAMIAKANQRQECEVLILARGGGSLEDLWPFNEEKTARAVFASELPIISGVGHETDTTICDFVADFRAETPTAAAVKAALSAGELFNAITTERQHLTRQLRHLLVLKQNDLHNLRAKLTLPKSLLNQKLLKLESLNQQLLHHAQKALQNKQHQLIKLSSRLSQQNPKAKLEKQRHRLEQLRKALSVQETHSRQQRMARLHELMKTLNVLSPLNTLERGYALALNKDKQVIHKTQDVAVNDEITLKLKDGSLDCRITKID
jgi:exodeoxyribonuclease VII large subunit